jgi:hypothetical protein
MNLTLRLRSAGRANAASDSACPTFPTSLRPIVAAVSAGERNIDE